MTLPRPLRLLYRAVQEAFADHAKDEAAGIAFWVFFALFPLALALLALVGHFLGTEEAQASVGRVLTESFPGSEGLVIDQLTEVVDNRGTLGLVGVVGLLWGASKGLGAVTRSINRAAGLKRSHPFFLSKLRHLGFTIICMLPLLAALGFSALVELPHFPILERLGFDGKVLSSALAQGASLALVMVTVALVFKLAPYKPVSWSQVLPGALLSAILLELAKRAFVIYLERGSNFEAVYGSMASIAVLLLWLYASAWVLILGAEYNIVRDREKRATEAT